MEAARLVRLVSSHIDSFYTYTVMQVQQVKQLESAVASEREHRNRLASEIAAIRGQLDDAERYVQWVANAHSCCHLPTAFAARR